MTARIHSAVNIIEAMKEALEKQQQLSVDMIHRFLDETEEEDGQRGGYCRQQPARCWGMQ